MVVIGRVGAGWGQCQLGMSVLIYKCQTLKMVEWRSCGMSGIDRTSVLWAVLRLLLLPYADVPPESEACLLFSDPFPWLPSNSPHHLCFSLSLSLSLSLFLSLYPAISLHQFLSYHHFLPLSSSLPSFPAMRFNNAWYAEKIGECGRESMSQR